MEKKKLIGFTTGVFDMFHIGHLNLLKNAKNNCDYLIVGITTDELSKQHKGITPTINQFDRFEIVSSIKYVDNVVFQNSYDKILAYNNYKFNIMFVGDDWKGSERWIELENKFKDLNVNIKYFPYYKGISSTILRDKLK